MIGWLAFVGGLRLSTRELGRLAIAGVLGVFGYNALFLGGFARASERAQRSAVFLVGIEDGFGEVGAERLLGDLIYVGPRPCGVHAARAAADTDPVRATTFAMVIARCYWRCSPRPRSGCGVV